MSRRKQRQPRQLNDADVTVSRDDIDSKGNNNCRGRCCCVYRRRYHSRRSYHSRCLVCRVSKCIVDWNLI